MKSFFAFSRKSEPVASSVSMPLEDVPTEIWSSDVFRKTAYGLELSRQQGNSAIPQRLRTVLMLTDGRTPISSFSSLLRSYGDVSEIFRLMLEMGLIEKVGSGHNFDRRSTDRMASGPSVNAQPAAEESSQALLEKLEALQRQQPGLNFPTQIRTSGSALPQANNGDIRLAATEICTALTDHLGLDGMDLSMAVERATDASALLALQPAIEEAMGKHAGAEGKRLIRNAYAKLR